jgi:hypothetical protein
LLLLLLFGLRRKPFYLSMPMLAVGAAIAPMSARGARRPRARLGEAARKVVAHPFLVGRSLGPGVLNQASGVLAFTPARPVSHPWPLDKEILAFISPPDKNPGVYIAIKLGLDWR